MTTSEPTTGELIEQLHTFDNVDAVTITIAKAALLFIADRLESQEQKIAEIENFHKEMLKDHKAQVAALTARAEQAEKERDAAIEHVHDAIFGTNHSCFYCTMENCDGCTNSTVKDHFKYRGLRPNKYLVGKAGGAE
jgi:hypothetical protein